jgi:hypothetical protein
VAPSISGTLNQLLPLLGPTRTINRVDHSHYSWYEDGERVTSGIGYHQVTIKVRCDAIRVGLNLPKIYQKGGGKCESAL